MKIVCIIVSYVLFEGRSSQILPLASLTKSQPKMIFVEDTQNLIPKNLIAFRLSFVTVVWSPQRHEIYSRDHSWTPK